MNNNSNDNLGSSKEPRYVFVDALRGVAALLVLLHHMLRYNVMEDTLRLALPAPFLAVCDYGAVGVQIFFVLSGFVIAHSLRNNPLTRQAIGNFILRRQLRLDPPYWCAIAFVTIVYTIERRHFPLTTPPLPGPAGFFLNAVYLQMITHATRIVGVGWTLCMEVQFYLVFILLLRLGQKSAMDAGNVQIAWPAMLLVLLSGLASMGFNLRNHDSPWFPQHWFYFAGGVLCYWAVKRRVAPAIFCFYVVLFAVNVIPCALYNLDYHGTPPLLSGLLTLILLYRAGQANRLTTWGNNRLIQYLGRISYSLYLVHLTVAVAVLKFGYKLTGSNHAAALLWFALAGLVSVLVAHLLYIIAERPSVRLAARLRRAPTAAAHGSTVPAGASSSQQATAMGCE